MNANAHPQFFGNRHHLPDEIGVGQINLGARRHAERALSEAGFVPAAWTWTTLDFVTSLPAVGGPASLATFETPHRGRDGRRGVDSLP